MVAKTRREAKDKVPQFFRARQVTRKRIGEWCYRCPQIKRIPFEEWQLLTGARRSHMWAKRHRRGHGAGGVKAKRSAAQTRGRLWMEGNKQPTGPSGFPEWASVQVWGWAEVLSVLGVSQTATTSLYNGRETEAWKGVIVRSRLAPDAFIGNFKLKGLVFVRKFFGPTRPTESAISGGTQSFVF